MISNVVSFSGGKDSTAMLHKLLEIGEPVSHVLFCDTGWEFPEIYDHVAKVECNTGIKIDVVHPYQPFEFIMCDREIKKGKRKGQRGYGWARPNARWCTTYKNQALDKFKRHIELPFNDCVGIAADEKRTLKASKRYPLIELGMTEKDCLEYCYSLGYTWSGLYEHLDRVSCFCCPLSKIGELEYLYRKRPELWQQIKRLDARCYNSFRISETISEIEARWG